MFFGRVPRVALVLAVVTMIDVGSLTRLKRAIGSVNGVNDILLLYFVCDTFGKIVDCVDEEHSAFYAFIFGE